MPDIGAFAGNQALARPAMCVRVGCIRGLVPNPNPVQCHAMPCHAGEIQTDGKLSDTPPSPAQPSPAPDSPLSRPSLDLVSNTWLANCWVDGPLPLIEGRGGE